MAKSKPLTMSTPDVSEAEVTLVEAAAPSVTLAFAGTAHAFPAPPTAIVAVLRPVVLMVHGVSAGASREASVPPEVPDVPEVPGVPESPDVPDVPEAPDVPALPDDPELASPGPTKLSNELSALQPPTTMVMQVMAARPNDLITKE
jgi:hypothetical protein